MNFPKTSRKDNFSVLKTTLSLLHISIFLRVAPYSWLAVGGSLVGWCRCVRDMHGPNTLMMRVRQAHVHLLRLPLSEARHFFGIV